MANKVVVLCASGMLCSMVADVLSRETEIEVIATVRSKEMIDFGKKHLPKADWRTFSVDLPTLKNQLDALGRIDWIVNAIGLTKPYTHDDNPAEVERATIGNTLFPIVVSQYAENIGAKVLQIGTDCVYSGVKGHYNESDKQDPNDAYGKTKSLGETCYPSMHILRTSIIGPEPKAYVFLIEWFLKQAQNSTVNGFTNHQWNGVTTLHFAKLCRGIIKYRPELPRVQHIIPTDEISKYELLKAFAESYRRQDITINPTEAGVVVDRTLSTNNPDFNRTLWKLAGYENQPPTIPQMVKEVANFDYAFKR